MQHLLQADKLVEPLTDAQQRPPPPDSPGWQSVALPDVVRRPLAVQSQSSAGRSIAWYRLPVVATQPCADATSAALAMYVPRVIAGPLQLWQWQPGGWQRVFDNQAWAAEQWNRPLLLPLIPPMPFSGSSPSTDARHWLALGVPFRDDRFHALSSVWVGPLIMLRPRFDARTSLQLSLPEAASLAMAALGGVSLAVWLHRRREHAYLYFGLASVAWPLRNLHLFINLPQGRLASDWFWWMTAASVSWVMLAMYFFTFCIDGRRWPRMERGLLLLVVVGGLLTLPVWNRDALVLQHAVNLSVALLVTLLLSRRAWHGGSPELRAIVFALLASFAFAVHDWLLVAMLITPESVYLLPYGSMLVVCSHLYAAQRRFVSAVMQVESANAMLAAQLAEREQTLQAQHMRLLSVEREQAVLLERQRLMREMHDGVGSTLIATLRVVESGASTADAVADLLRMAIEDLRLAIDSLEPIEHDLATLMATLRLRIGRRLDGAGLRLHWSMDDLPPLPWLDASQALQILRLLQEALSNVIKHARAKTVWISASVVDAAVQVRITDDGRGFDATQVASGRGIPSMHQRSLTLGATLALHTSPGNGLMLTLRLPLQRVPQ